MFRFDVAKAEPWADRLRCCRLGLVWLTGMAMVLLVVTETLCLVPGGGMSRSGCVRSGRCPSIGETVFASVRSKCVGRSSFPCRRPRDMGLWSGFSGRYVPFSFWRNPVEAIQVRVSKERAHPHRASSRDLTWVFGNVPFSFCDPPQAATPPPLDTCAMGGLRTDRDLASIGQCLLCQHFVHIGTHLEC